jgi:HSP20 family protein
MNTTRLANLLPAGALSREIDRVMQDFWRGFPSATELFSAGGTPPINVREHADRFEAEVELPGLKLEDVEVLVKGRELSIRGQRAEPKLENAAWHRRERAFGDFARVIHLPADIDGDKVAAQLANGVLSVTLPKSQTAIARRIQIASRS